MTASASPPSIQMRQEIEIVAGAHESERGGGMRESERERERGRESAQADLYLSPTDIFLCCKTQSIDLLVVDGGTATHNARCLLKTYSGRVNVCLFISNNTCEWMNDVFFLTLTGHVCFRREG